MLEVAKKEESEADEEEEVRESSEEDAGEEPKVARDEGRKERGMVGTECPVPLTYTGTPSGEEGISSTRALGPRSYPCGRRKRKVR